MAPAITGLQPAVCGRMLWSRLTSVTSRNWSGHGHSSCAQAMLRAAACRVSGPGHAGGPPRVGAQGFPAAAAPQPSLQQGRVSPEGPEPSTAVSSASSGGSSLCPGSGGGGEGAVGSGHHGVKAGPGFGSDQRQQVQLITASKHSGANPLDLLSEPQHGVPCGWKDWGGRHAADTCQPRQLSQGRGSECGGPDPAS